MRQQPEYEPKQSFDMKAYERGEYGHSSEWHIPGISPLTTDEEIIDVEWEEIEDSCDAYRNEIDAHVVCIATQGGRELLQSLLQIEASKRTMDTSYNPKLIETIICAYHKAIQDVTE